MGTLMRTASLTALSSLLALQVQAQQLPAGCDNQLNPRAGGDDDSYKVRGGASGWCEGKYKRSVGNRILTVDALTLAADPIVAKVLKKTDSLSVQWMAPPGAVVHLTGRQVTDDSRPDYKLDAEVKTGANGVGKWSWPTALLRKFGMWPVATLGPDDDLKPIYVSVQGAAHLPGAQEGDSMFIPIRVSHPSDTSANRSRIEIVMHTAQQVKLDGLKLQRRFSADSVAEVKMAPGCPAPRNSRIPGNPVRVMVCMPPGAERGVYVLTVGAGTTATSLSLYHATTPVTRGGASGP
ncbi:MAG: hypothetical protein ABIY52_16050 [Gemmatimonadaceae bacterium]